MKFIEELKSFLKSIISGVLLLIGLSFVFFIFPTSNPLIQQVFLKVEKKLLPPEVHLFVSNPLSAFISEMELALLLSFLILVPFFLYKIIRYLSPALMKHERRLLLQALIPSSILFFGGSLFAYFFIIPSTFKILYPFAVRIGATPLFSLEEFMSSVFSLMLATGFMFLLPIFMVLLSAISIVDPDFWLAKLKYALFLILVFTAIITPDGTGITMMLLFVPLAALYLVGCVCARRFRVKEHVTIE